MPKAQGHGRLACPRCHSPLQKTTRKLRCPTCLAVYPIVRGLPHLYPPPTAHSKPKPFHYQFGFYDVVDFARRNETPFFLGSEAIFTNKVLTLRNSLSANNLNTKLYYSLKTCYEPPILRVLKRQGFGVEVGSALELDLALHQGFSPKAIIFDGPAKTDTDLMTAIRHNIATIIVDSLEEIRRIKELTPPSKPVALGVRIQSQAISPSPVSFTQRRFGVDIPTLQTKVPKALKTAPHLKLHMLMAHLGSQISSVSLYARLLRKLLELASLLNRKGLPITELNIGGGFPSQHLKLGPLKLLATLASGQLPTPPPSLSNFIYKLNRLARQEFSTYPHSLTLVAEPGRSLVSPAVILVTKVIAIKANWLILDASTNYIPEPYTFGKHPIFLAENPHQTPQTRYHIAGSSLSTQDVFALSFTLPNIKVGDILIIEEAGAYSLSRANQFTVPIPPFYWIDSQGRMTLTRRRGTYADTLSPYNI